MSQKKMQRKKKKKLTFKFWGKFIFKDQVEKKPTVIKKECSNKMIKIDIQYRARGQWRMYFMNVN